MSLCNGLVTPQWLFQAAAGYSVETVMMQSRNQTPTSRDDSFEGFEDLASNPLPEP